jgi:1-acyl-sn-glycerol-3-phosphate acyltransferase
MTAALLRRILLACVRFLVGAHARWQAPPPEGQCLFFANHSSHLDTLAIMAALPGDLRAVTHPVAALDYWGKNAVTRFIAERCLDAVLVERGARGKASPLAPLEAPLEQGENLVIFPEGTRGSGPIAPFKSGLYHLARHFPETPLVPIYIDNLHRVMPKGHLLPVPIICSLRFGAPLLRHPDEGKEAFLARARQALLDLGGSHLAGPEAA